MVINRHYSNLTFPFEPADAFRLAAAFAELVLAYFSSRVYQRVFPEPAQAIIWILSSMLSMASA
jgi:hypothetical protein